MEETHRQYHEASMIFPLLQGDEFKALKVDIAANGLLEAIWLHPDGSILDGRNRHCACIETGTEARFRTWNGAGSAVTFVVSMNLHRRHLTSSQRAVIALDMLPMLEAEAKERQLATLKQGGIVPDSQRFDERETGRATQQTAKIAQTNRQYVSDAKKLQDEAPDFLEEVRQGNLTISQAKRKHARERDERRILALEPVTGKFRTILIDPPWDYGSLSLAGRAAPQYAVMGDEELLALPLPGWADEQCHLYLWTTNNFLGRALALVESWGFAYKTLITWVKPSFGLGSYFRNSTEHCLFAIKGNLTTRVKNIPTHFEAKRQGHSVKPDMIYSIAERASYPPRLEVFARQERREWERAFHE